MRSEARAVPDRGWTDRLLWIGTLVPPIAFLADLLARYTLVGPTCEAKDKLVLHLVTAAAFLVCAVPALLAWRAWRRMQAGEGERGGEGGPAVWRSPALSRSHFLALAAAGLGAFCALAILANAVPGLVLGPCQ
jgi:hypothetical protein